MIPKFEIGRDFCTMHLSPSFIILCLLVRKLSCWQTHKQTNEQTDRQTPLQTSSALRYATTLGKNWQINGDKQVECARTWCVFVLKWMRQVMCQWVEATRWQGRLVMTTWGRSAVSQQQSVEWPVLRRSLHVTLASIVVLLAPAVGAVRAIRHSMTSLSNITTFHELSDSSPS